MEGYDIKAVQLFLPDNKSREYALGDGYTKKILHNNKNDMITVVSLNGLISKFINMKSIIMSSNKDVDLTKDGK